MGRFRMLRHCFYRNGLRLALILAAPAAAQDPGFSPSTAGITIPTKAWASLGDPTTQQGKEWYVPDAVGGSSLVISDGTAWRIFARGVSLQTYTLTSADNGSHTFTYTMGTIPNVQYSIVDNTTAGGITSNLYNVTATQATVKVNRNLLTALFGGVVTGVTINLFVAPNN